MAELNRRCRHPQTAPKTRDRLEMLRLANAGWSIPRIAQHFGLTQSRARHWVKAFLTDGFAALANKTSPGPKRKLTPEIIAHLKQVVGQDGRTWTAPQVMDWLQEQYSLSVNRTWLCEVMNQNGMSYKRTTRHVRHKQTPEQVVVKKADLETLKRGPRPA